MRILRNVVTGHVKTISAWAKQFDKMMENGDLSGYDRVREQIKNGDLVPVKHREK